MNFPTRTIVIVGGGFSGTTVAANLLRHSHGSVRIVLVERATHVARGTAYAARDHKYLLNVPAGRMSAKASEPLEFLAFARNRIPHATADDFLPRALYGEYLEASLLTAELSAPPDVRLERVRAEVSAVERVEGSASFRLQLDDDRVLIADDVVLALGNPAPATLPVFEGLRDSPRYIDDPWAAAAACRPGDTVIIVGTGLTMADVATAATLACRGSVKIHAISRHGLLPPTQTAFRHSPCHGDSAALLREASTSARRLMRAVRRLARDTQDQGGDWREAVTFVRNIAPAIWQQMPMAERRRFLRHVRSYWDVHRHRLPQDTVSQLDQLRQEDRLTINAGRILSAVETGDKVRVTWRPRGAAGSFRAAGLHGLPHAAPPVSSTNTQTLLVDRVINCTGPDYNPRRSRDPLMRSLLSQRLASPDALNLGLRTRANGALIDSRGHDVEHLYYIGPQLRADYWEATAAQELRSHAERLARHLSEPREYRYNLRNIAAAVSYGA